MIVRLAPLVALALVAGCAGGEGFVTPATVDPEQTAQVWAAIIDADTPPFAEGEDASLYLVEQRIEIPFRPPTERELMDLTQVEGLAIPYPTLPYVQRGNIEIEIDWTLSNLSEQRVVADVVVNGINEFHEYNPAAQVVDDDLVIDFAGYERSYRIDGGARLRGTIREELMDEVAVDLATVVNGAPNANQITFFENQSAVDARSRRFIPDVVPALTGVRVGLRATSPVPLLLEFTVRVRDERGVLELDLEAERWERPAPALFGPMDAAAAFEAMMTAP
jgi:hypothetical protein